MRTPQEAIADILRVTLPLVEQESIPLADTPGRVLAQDVFSDLDLPPFEKSAMDGFAVRSADLAKSGGSLRCIGESRAGEAFAGAIGAGECVEIYTGAELPSDCDAVVMIEKTERDGDTVRFEAAAPPAQHVCHRGEDLRSGERVVAQGKRLSEADLSPLAAVGCEPVPVFRRPRVAVLSTGDELVPPHEKPGPGQIREGNTIQLTALARRAGAEATNIGVVRDDQPALEKAFAQVVSEYDAVVITGGVSMGKYDLVGRSLEQVGVSQVFHKIAIKPGKPLWFGQKDRTLVFGLPGNPVSCLVGHEVFVRPALAKLAGAAKSEWGEQKLRLGRWMGSEPRPIPRQQNIPITIRQGADGVDELEPVRWKGSGDVVGLARATGLAVCPPNETLVSGALAAFRYL